MGSRSILSRYRIRPVFHRGTNFRPAANPPRAPCVKSHAIPRWWRYVTIAVVTDAGPAVNDRGCNHSIDHDHHSRLMKPMTSRLRVTVWGENVHEKENPTVREIYPKGMHTTIADGLAEKGEFDPRTATLQDSEHGLSEDVLETTDV